MSIPQGLPPFNLYKSNDSLPHSSPQAKTEDHEYSSESCEKFECNECAGKSDLDTEEQADYSTEREEHMIAYHGGGR